MEVIIREMIKKAIYYKDYKLLNAAYDLLKFTRDLIEKMAATINCPSNWRYIGEELAQEYKDNSWVFDELELWNYEEWKEI